MVLLGFLLGCSPSEPLNVLLISIDTLRPDHLSSYGGRWPTPGFDGLAAQGVRFESAYSTSPWTLPAHASMLSGRYPASIDDDPNSFDLFREAGLVSVTLKEHGYATGAVTGGLYVGSKFGLDAHFDYFEEEAKNQDLARARRWLAEHGREPFFFFFHTYVVHAPYEDRRYAEGDGGRLKEIYEGGVLNAPHMAVCCAGFSPTREERDFLIALYQGGVAAADRKVAALWKLLGDLGLRDETLVVVTSDHGEEFWEHTGRAAYHGHTLYDELLRVPLIWVDPERRGSARVVTEPVSLVDIVPTVLGRLGLEVPPSLDGVDLAPLLEDGRWNVDRVLLAEASRNGPERYSVRSDLGKLIVTVDPAVQRGEGVKFPVPVRAPVELYDAADAAESHDLAGQEPERVRMLRQHVDPRIRRLPSGRSSGSLEGLDDETRRKLRALGYAE